MTEVSAPAKLNLSLLVHPARTDGLHPVDSMVQTIEWCDALTMVVVDERADRVVVSGVDLDPEDNLVAKALRELREARPGLPRFEVDLRKEIPMAAGLGGGSADAAGALFGAAQIAGAENLDLHEVASRLGSDVPLFLTGGSLLVGGVGESIESIEPLEGFAVAVVVPDFGLSTAEVYRRWDALEGPVGDAVPDGALPPQLRGGMPMRNDLLRAALDLEPGLGDLMADVRSVWGAPVCLTGSGSAFFGYFAELEEAADAAGAVAHLSAHSRGVALRDHGVSAEALVES